MAFFAHTRPVADGVFNRTLGLSFNGLTARIAAWNDRRVTRRELESLSDRELNDIGLGRGEIDDVIARMR